MKAFVFVFVAVLILSGCGSATLVKYGYSRIFVGKLSNAESHIVNSDSTVGALGPSFIQRGARYKVLGELSSGLGPKYMLMVHESKSYYVKASDLQTLCQFQVDSLGSTFYLPKEKGEIAWGRAVTYVLKHSDMKIQTQTEYVIDTYNPTIIKDRVARSFLVTKEAVEGGGMKFKVQCNTNNPFDAGTASGLERECSYYMVFGEECN